MKSARRKYGATGVKNATDLDETLILGAHT